MYPTGDANGYFCIRAHDGEVVMSLPKQDSKELQQVIMQAIKNAMIRFENGNHTNVEEFTCYGFKTGYGADKEKWMAYVCTNIKSLGKRNYILESEIADSVQKSLRVFHERMKYGVGLHSIMQTKETKRGNPYFMIGYHWHTDY